MHHLEKSDNKAYLNLGCGDRFHKDWINLDIEADAQEVIGYNLHKGIPFGDNTFDVVYHSHLLEHFTRDSAIVFMQECFRVLKYGGLIRVVVPDLENIVREYLLALEQSLAQEPGAEANYDWMMLELLDQAVRDCSGGAMIDYLSQSTIQNETFVFSRLGREAKRAIEDIQNQRFRSKISTLNFQGIIRSVRNAPLRLLLGKTNFKAIQIGRFRMSGEAHFWMYDRYSLSRLLHQVGFIETIQRSAYESAFPDWSKFNLDTESDGTIYKPDSLYMEAIKPSGEASGRV